MIQCADITHALITLVVCLYCVASLSGRPIVCHAAITALRPRLVPCYAYRVPVGTPYRLSCRHHGTAPKACTVLCISHPCRDALSAVILLSYPVPTGTKPCITRYKRTESSQCRDKTPQESVMALRLFFGLSAGSAYPPCGLCLI